jgi:uncharacterized OB-fold protein
MTHFSGCLYFLFMNKFFKTFDNKTTYIIALVETQAANVGLKINKQISKYMDVGEDTKAIYDEYCRH